MKTIKKADEIRRVKDKDAFEMVKSGWAFIKKSIWKKDVRDKSKEKKVEKVEKIEKAEKAEKVVKVKKEDKGKRAYMEKKAEKK